MISLRQELARELIQDAILKHASAPPLIAVPARFHIARVVMTWNKEQAHTFLHAAIRELSELLRAKTGLEVLRTEACLLTAATAPELIALLQLRRHSVGFQFQLVQTMLNHGHQESACNYLVGILDSAEFPQFAVAMVLAHALNGDRKLALARRSVQAWRELRERKSDDERRPPLFGPGNDFIRSFNAIWRILPHLEGSFVLKELINEIRNEDDRPITANIDPEGRVKFTSSRQHRLFQLLEATQELAPALIDSLADSNPEFAAAAGVFPYGPRSVREAWERKASAQSASAKRGRIVGGSSEEDFVFADALLDSIESKDFSVPLQLALRSLGKDLEQNGAPKECWPSSQAFRQILYSAGTVLGGEARPYLEAIPDLDVRMFSQIELASALAGLPEYAGSRASGPKTQRSG